MVKNLVKVFGVAMFCFLTTFRGHAGIPTIDVANIVQTTITSIETLQQGVQLYQQIDNQIEGLRRQYNQIQNQVRQIESLNGDYLKDMLLNNASYRSKRRLVPDTYKKVLELYKNVGVVGHEIATNAGWDARDEMQIKDAEEYFDDVDTEEARIWIQNENNAMASVGVAESAYQRADSLLEETEELMADIKQSTDAKAAQDLANRMEAQTQIMIAELLRLQSSQATSQGRGRLYDHAMRGQDRERAGVSDDFGNILD